MRTVLFSALAALALAGCNPPAPTTQGKHADAIEQPTPAAGSEPARNVPGGGSGTAASEEQDSGHGTETSAEPKHASPPKP